MIFDIKSQTVITPFDVILYNCVQPCLCQPSAAKGRWNQVCVCLEVRRLVLSPVVSRFSFIRYSPER